MSQQKQQPKKLYPIIPIHFPYSSISQLPNQNQEDDAPLSSLSPFANYLTHFIRALAAKNSIHTSQQTDEILALLQNPQTKIETRKLKKTAYTYRHVPQKVRESISAKRPTSLGTSCGFAEYGLIRIYLFDEEAYGRKWGFEKGDMVLDTRTYIPPPNIHRSRLKTEPPNENRGKRRSRKWLWGLSCQWRATVCWRRWRLRWTILSKYL